MRTSFILAMAALALGATANPHVRYRVVGLGDLPGGATISEGLALNDLGQVVGRSHNGATRGFIWDAQNGMRDIGDLPGGSDMSYATGINNLGQVTGYSWAATTRAILWTEEGGLQDIGELPGGWDFSQGFAINDEGWITGVSNTTGGNYVGFRFRNGSMTALPGLVSPTSSSHGYAINSAGHIAGYAQSSEGPAAFRWDPQQGMVSLGDLPGGNFNSRALGMNDFGEVVGWGTPVAGRRAFVWSEETGMVDLGELPGGTGSSEAHDINNFGVVVGKSNVLGGSRGFIWTEEDGMIDLNLLLAPGQGFTITDAMAINDFGQITGIAIRNGVSEAFLATPIREVTGEVVLSDWDASSEGVEIEYWISVGDLVEYGTAPLDALGRVTIPTTLDDGRYRLTIRASHWLLRTTMIDILGGGAQFAMTLINGDCNGDNEVSVGDYAVISSAFGSSEGEPGWDPQADLNGDGSVDIGDLAILSTNFGLSGD